MSKLFLSVRITESFFTSEEITKIKDKLNTNNKSEFLRKAIRNYLKMNCEEELADNQNQDIERSSQDVEELKELVQKNYILLQELKSGAIKIDSNEFKDAYDGDQQQIQTEKVLGLLDEF
jgi:Arc/MetJ-type ribon-helix-helix transcriptional regulator